MKKLLGQVLGFLAVSGTGWLLDFGVYLLLTNLLGFNVAYANMLSCIPALTFVFIVSTRKVFDSGRSRLPQAAKYAIYFLYQMVLVFCVSLLGQWLFGWVSRTGLMRFALVANHLKLLCKLAITPITMTANFFVMKLLAEKL